MADFNGDGRPDFATGSAVMGARGPGQPRPGGRLLGDAYRSTCCGRRPSSAAVAAGDFDGDGRHDLAVGYTNYELGVWRTGIDVLLSPPDGSWDRRPLGSEETGPRIYGARPPATSTATARWTSVGADRRGRRPGSSWATARARSRASRAAEPGSRRTPAARAITSSWPTSTATARTSCRWLRGREHRDPGRHGRRSAAREAGCRPGRRPANRRGKSR